jgi:hypothetical protein
MPLDAAPVDPGLAEFHGYTGTFVLRDNLSPEGPLAIAATKAQMPYDSAFYTSHFATCPDAATHRRA